MSSYFQVRCRCCRCTRRFLTVKLRVSRRRVRGRKEKSGETTRSKRERNANHKSLKKGQASPRKTHKQTKTHKPHCQDQPVFLYAQRRKRRRDKKQKTHHARLRRVELACVVAGAPQLLSGAPGARPIRGLRQSPTVEDALPEGRGATNIKMFSSFAKMFLVLVAHLVCCFCWGGGESSVGVYRATQK